MSYRIIIISCFLLTAQFLSLNCNGQINYCFLSYNKTSGLKMQMAEKLPPGAEKIRQLKIDTGIVNITRIDGYRILYNNDKDAPFVNMKVEQSESKEYINDQQKLIANLAYINTHSANSESDKLIELNYGGYKVYGSNRNSISTGTTILGTFILFPGDNTTVYLYFNNLKPDVRHYENVEEYKKLRDHFIEGYIKNLQSCEK